MPRRTEEVTDESSAAVDTSQPLVNTESVGDGGPAEDPVARRAYQRFEERGREHGHDLEDWFEAEREVRAQRSE